MSVSILAKGKGIYRVLENAKSSFKFERFLNSFER